MKRYKLLKDTLTVKAGAIFKEEGTFDDEKRLVQVTKDGCQFSPWVVVRDIINFNDWFEEIPEKYKRPRAELSKAYHYVNNYGGISADWEKGSLEDNYRYDSGNYSVTGSGLEKYKDKLIAQQTIEDDAKGFMPDWKNEGQEKYYGYYVHRFDSLHFDSSNCYQQQGTIYFKTVEDIEESFDKHREEWFTVLGIE
jgi:hypothetical protein